MGAVGGALSAGMLVGDDNGAVLAAAMLAGAAAGGWLGSNSAAVSTSRSVSVLPRPPRPSSKEVPDTRRCAAPARPYSPQAAAAAPTAAWTSPTNPTTVSGKTTLLQVRRTGSSGECRTVRQLVVKDGQEKTEDARFCRVERQRASGPRRKSRHQGRGEGDQDEKADRNYSGEPGCHGRLSRPFAQVGVPTGENSNSVRGSAPTPRCFTRPQDQFKQRVRERERYTPGWIWESVTSMNKTPQKMSYTFRVIEGQRVLIASGMIDGDAATNLQAALNAHRPIHEVWLNSPGGNSRVGVEMGNIMRKQQLLTRVRAGDGCASACSTAFLGGVMRDVEPGAAYGVHMYTTQIDSDRRARPGRPSTPVQWGGAQGAAERMAYVQRMGVGLKWLQLWSDTAPGLYDVHVANRIAGSFCQQSAISGGADAASNKLTVMPQGMDERPV